MLGYFRVARDARPKALFLVEDAIEVVSQSRDQRKVLSAIRLVFVVVDVPDKRQQVSEELCVFIHRV